MGRPMRFDPEGGWHHVVNRGVERRDIFQSDVDRLEFGRLLGVAHERFGLTVHAYCLMTNHYHLLVECPEGQLSEAMQVLGSVYVRHFNERVGRDGPLFRSRFFARPVITDAAVVAVARYIHRNPLAFLDLHELDTYRWSSLRTYLGYRRCPPWLETDVVLSLSGGPHGIRTLMEPMHGGDERAAATADVWSHLVDVVVDEHLDDVAGQRAERTVMTLLLDRVEPGAADALRAVLEFPTANAEWSARSRARRRARDHPVFDRAARAVIDAA